MTAEARIAVVGGGLMGAGISLSFAVAGHAVKVFEPVAEVAASLRDRIAKDLRLIGEDEAAVSRITAVHSLAEALEDADYVTEAAPEKLELKRSLFAQIADLAPSQVILATNTSVMPIHSIADGNPAAARIVGTHWWNPAHLIPLVEVIPSRWTRPEIVDAAMALLAAIGKTPAQVRKDAPGFVANRLQHALWREAIAMVAEGVCDAETLDRCVKSSFGLRLAVLGPLENADLVGLDLTLDIHNVIIPELDRHDRPHEYLRARVERGKLGFKSGEGFRAWGDTEMSRLKTDLAAHLLQARPRRPA